MRVPGGHPDFDRTDPTRVRSDRLTGGGPKSLRHTGRRDPMGP
jgi:hypothetical protein